LSKSVNIFTDHFSSEKQHSASPSPNFTWPVLETGVISVLCCVIILGVRVDCDQCTFVPIDKRSPSLNKAGFHCLSYVVTPVMSTRARENSKKLIICKERLNQLFEELDQLCVGPDMTVNSFLRALRRFIARSGRPQLLRSDNFQTFHLVGQDRLAKEGIEWKFINERAPWCGGYWECLVRSIKVALSKVLGRCHAKPDELHTVLCEMEARINGRPLTTVSDRPDGQLALTREKLKLVPNVHCLKHLTPLQLADDFNGNSGAFDVLIGWIICGQMTNEKREPTSFSHSVKVLYAKVDEQLDEAIRKFWEIETIRMMDDSDKADVDSSGPVQNFESTLQFDGIRYTVRLPWLKDDAQLPNNYHQALRRLQQIERSLKNDPRKAAHYERGRIWYLLHHAVIREDNIITKCRIVFDGSAQYGGVALNQNLDVGPALQNDPIKIEMSADFCGEAAMFKKHLASIALKAMYVIRYHVKKYQRQFPEALNEVLENMYVDDLLFSVDEEESACEMVAQLRKMMKLGGILLAKWDSNQNAVLAGVPSGSVTEESNNPMLKALGITWNAERDELSYTIPSNVDPNALDTKRQLISTTAKMYDTLGYLSPYLITAKILFQRLWQQGVDWDEKLPDNRKQQPGETVAEFIADLRRFSQGCNFVDLETMLRDRLVCGLRDEAVQLRLFAKKVLTFQMAQEEALSAEAACKHACEIRAATSIHQHRIFITCQANVKLISKLMCVPIVEHSTIERFVASRMLFAGVVKKLVTLNACVDLNKGAPSLRLKQMLSQ
ncbi:hypothetical protein T12_4199, partial [Trichinella patagoniensis]